MTLDLTTDDLSMDKNAEFNDRNNAVANYNNHKDLLFAHLKMLPPTELHYYFALLVASIENEPNPEKHIHLIIQAISVVKKLNQFYEDVHNKSNPDLTEVTTAINELIRISEMHSTPQKVKKAILGLCSTISGFIIGVIGAVSGVLGGLLSDYTLIGNLRNSGLGFITGLAIGSILGSRCPELAFQSTFERKLEFCIDSIDKVSKELPSKKTHAEYEEETKQYIFDVFFKDIPDTEKESAFNRFLNNENESFQVSTTTAGFISRSLKGNLGHHSLIAFSINGKKDTPIEYGDRIKTPGFFDQNESPRIVTGKKLFDMLVLDRILQETYRYTLSGFAKDYDAGSNDCRTYVDKVLIGTNQAPTQINRFNATTDKWTGTNIVGPLIRFFSKTEEMELKPIIKHYKQDPNAPDPLITARKWTGKKEQPSEEHQEVSSTKIPSI